MVNWEQHRGLASDWDAYVALLAGGFYQTFGWGEARRVAGWQPLRLLALSGGRVVAVASVLVKRKLGIAVCWIPGGPLGDLKVIDREFRQALVRELRTAFVYCRLSILSAERDAESDLFARGAWVRPAVSMSSGLTMSYALQGSQSERLKRASVNWRHNLKRAKRYDLRIEHWEQPNLTEIAQLYREMEALKSLSVQHTEEELAAIFSRCRNQVITYRCVDSEGRLLAIRSAGLVGLGAMDLLAASGKAARKVYASHATLWCLLDHCCQLGLTEYDLSGVDPIGNKGVFDFKRGTGAVLVQCLGEWEWASLPGLRWVVNRALEHKRD